MPWDFFCPVCSNILDGDMTEDTDVMTQQWLNLQNDLYHCDQCHSVVSFNHKIIDLDHYAPPKDNTVTIHAASYTNYKIDPIKIKGITINSIGIYKIQSVTYNIVF